METLVNVRSSTMSKCRRRLSPIALLLILSACQTTGSHSSGSPRANEPVADLNLMLCKTNVNNPPSNNNGLVIRKAATACTQGIDLLVAPAPKACMTSGFGLRNGRPHNGIDYQSKPAGAVVSAADGTVIIRQWREKDFGNWLVIDHGQGVYTSYGHLASINSDVVKGARVSRGSTLGIMGATGNATNSIHLHVEYRVGNIRNPRGYFGLKPINPFSLPARCS